VSGPCTLLVVDDEEDIRLVMRMLFESRGYRVLEAAEGGEALTVLRQQRPDVILLDLMMPGMDGVEFRAHQQKDPDLVAIPVVLISGGGGVAKKAEELGVAGYLTKPPELQHVLAEIARHCPK
jgi:CheY-like chemotaxis protein